MENLNDEEIQRLIELQIKEHRVFEDADQDIDVQIYSLLFKELENNPVGAVDGTFTGILVRLIELKQEKLERIYYSLAITIAFLSILGIGCAAIATMDVGHAHVITHFLTVHKESILFIALTFISIKLTDGYIVKWKSGKGLDEINASS